MARLPCLINLNIYRGYKYRKPLESIFMRNLNLFIMKCISIYFVTLLLLMSGCESGRRIILKDLRCENLENPVAIDNTHPHFSWKIETDGQTMRQAYFEIQVATDSSLLAQGKADLWNSGKVESSASVMEKSCDLVCWPIGKSGYGAIKGNPRTGVRSIALGSGFWIKRNGKGNI